MDALPTRPRIPQSGRKDERVCAPVRGRGSGNRPRPSGESHRPYLLLRLRSGPSRPDAETEEVSHQLLIGSSHTGTAGNPVLNPVCESVVPLAPYVDGVRGVGGRDVLSVDAGGVLLAYELHFDSIRGGGDVDGVDVREGLDYVLASGEGGHKLKRIWVCVCVHFNHSDVLGGAVARPLKGLFSCPRIGRSRPRS